MRKLRNEAGESLDMLLDALCNVFGSLILISCLLVLMTNGPAATEGGALVTNADEQTLLERRLQAAEQELKGLKKLKLKQATGSDAILAALAAELEALRKTQERLRADKSAVAEADAKPATGDPTAEIDRLRREIRALEEKIANAEVMESAGDATEKDLQNRIARIKDQLKNTVPTAEEQVRFPKEKNITKTPVNMILKYGEIFPLTGMDGQPFPGITREQKEGEEGFAARPNQSSGWRPVRNLTQLREVLAAARREGWYMSLYVYPDSFEVFRALREQILETGVDYGFEVLPEHYTMTFGPKGTSPKPL